MRSDRSAQRHHKRGGRLGKAFWLTLMSAMATIVAAIIGAAAVRDGGSAPVPPVVVGTPAPASSATATPAQRHRVPEGNCEWRGETRCKLKTRTDPSGATSDCDGSGKQGSGSCNVRVR